MCLDALPSLNAYRVIKELNSSLNTTWGRNTFPVVLSLIALYIFVINVMSQSAKTAKKRKTSENGNTATVFGSTKLYLCVSYMRSSKCIYVCCSCSECAHGMHIFYVFYLVSLIGKVLKVSYLLNIAVTRYHHNSNSNSYRSSCLLGNYSCILVLFSLFPRSRLMIIFIHPR